MYMYECFVLNNQYMRSQFKDGFLECDTLDEAKIEVESALKTHGHFAGIYKDSPPWVDNEVTSYKTWRDKMLDGDNYIIIKELNEYETQLAHTMMDYKKHGMN